MRWIVRVVVITIVFIGGSLFGGAVVSFSGQNMSAPAPVETTLPTPSPVSDTLYTAIDAMDQVVISLYERVSPSVVHIISRMQTTSPFFGSQSSEGTGSGFFYDQQGHIVTNFHVIENAFEVDVVLANGESVPAELVGVDEYNDLAVLHVAVAAETVAPLEIGDSSNVHVGQTVIAIGNPFGLDRTLTTGIISALNRRLETDAGTFVGQAIQTDAAINPGNSGGPLLDVRGRVIGVNTAINSPTGASVGIGFAVPASVIQRVVPELIANGRYLHADLGVSVAELGTEVTPGENSVSRGLLVTSLARSGGAAQAGLQAAEVFVRRGRYVFSGGDIITAINGEPIYSRSDMLIYLEENYRPGDTVTLTIVRDGQTMDVEATLSAR
ncbi:MAG: 2-alkenal reductase [Anaerolineaceae bacterium]|nr:2-alkenal reductase [Anaerolineaceae bacterium]